MFLENKSEFSLLRVVHLENRLQSLELKGREVREVKEVSNLIQQCTKLRYLYKLLMKEVLEQRNQK